MKALVLYGPNDLKLEEVEAPSPGPGEVLVRVKRVGICGTDKAFFKGTYRPGKLPIIPGHEVFGEIVEVGEGVDGGYIGRPVTSEINFYCGKCSYCREGLRTHCPYRKVLGITVDGGMAEYMITRADLVHDVSGLSPVEAAFVEPLAAVIEMLEMHPVRDGDTVAVIGSGTVGLLSMRVLRAIARPSLLVAIAREGSPKLRYVRASGVDDIVDEKRAIEYARAVTKEGQGFDYVVEASGDPGALELAVELVRPRGVIAAKSTHGAPTSFNLTKLVVKEARIVGSRCGPFDKAIDLLRRKLVKVEDLVTSEEPLERGVEAFRKSFERDQVKVHIIP